MTDVKAVVDVTPFSPGVIARRRVLDPGVSDAAAAGERIRLFLCGDVMTGRGVDQIMPRPGDPRLREPWMTSAEDYVRLAERRNGPIPRSVSPDYIWGAALETWRRMRPDARIANLETSVTQSRTFAPKDINYRMNPANAGCLAPARLSCCALANNHVLDFGTRGLLDTLDVLHAQGLATAGAGRDLEQARGPAILDLGPKGRVLVAAMGAPDSGVPYGWAAGPLKPGVNLTDLSAAAAGAFAAALKPVRRPGDLVVASLHWGANWGYEIPEAHRRFAHALIDAADVALIHGHSSHHAKAMEVYRGRLILYGCGDFLNDYEGIEGYESYRGDLAVMYFADLDPAGALRALEMVPLQIRRFRLNRPSPQDVAWIAGVLGREAASFGARVRLSGDRLLLAAPASPPPRAQSQSSVRRSVRSGYE